MRKLKGRRKPHVKPGAVTRRTISKKVGAFDFTEPLLVGAGAIGGTMLDKLLPNIDPKLKAGGKIALGALLPMFIKSPKMKNTVHYIGNGLVACGAIDLSREMGLIGKVGALEDDDFLVVSLDGVGETDTEEFEEFTDVSDMNDVVNDDVLNDDVSVVNDDVSVVNDDVLNGDFDRTY
jgi:hypothetical protein